MTSESCFLVMRHIMSCTHMYDSVLFHRLGLSRVSHESAHWRLRLSLMNCFNVHGFVGLLPAGAMNGEHLCPPASLLFSTFLYHLASKLPGLFGCFASVVTSVCSSYLFFLRFCRIGSSSMLWNLGDELISMHGRLPDLSLPCGQLLQGGTSWPWSISTGYRGVCTPARGPLL